MNEQPAVTVRRVDAPATSEDALFHGYAGAVSHLETRPCVCGGTVTADPFRPAPGVAAHQFTSRHKAWRAANGFDD